MSLDPRLVAQLRVRPRDWSAWLVLADWLTEHNDERGELVRLRHRLATEPLTATNSWELRELVLEREAEITVAFAATVGSVEGVRLDWQDGFVVSTRVTAIEPATRDFVEGLDGHPAVLFDERTLAPRGPVGVHSWLQHAKMFRFTRLALSGQRLTPYEVAAMAECEALAGVWWLDLSGNPIEDAGVGYLVEASWFGDLTWLDLEECQIQLVGATRLVRAADAGAMGTLILRRNPFTPSRLPFRSPEAVATTTVIV
ncbi:MAG: TIGR02996 domain-containing protein [Myxococcota bacterium]